MDERLQLETAVDAAQISLVQRVRIKATTQPGNIDHHFEFDYMGSSEFEWGALPAALRAMRSTKLELAHIEVTGQTCWYVGPDKELDAAYVLFADQLKPASERRRLRELSYLHESYFPEAPPVSARKRKKPAFALRRDFDGWWAIEATFILFRQREHAQIWLDALERGRKS